MNASSRSVCQEKNMPSNSIFAIAAIAVLIPIVLVLKKGRSDRAKNQPAKLVEAKKNTLRSELHDLGLGIRQVQGYIDALKGDEKATVEARQLAQAELDKASELKASIEQSMENATTDAQVDGFALGLEHARLHVRKARSQALFNKQDEDDEDN